MAGQRHYPEPQREALLQAVVINGLSIAEAVRRAKAGTLGDVSPFTIPYSSAKTIVANGRDAFAVSAPDRAHGAIDRAALQLVGQALRAANQLADDADPVAIKRTADALVAARRALPPQPKTPKPAEPQEPTTTAPDPAVAALLKAAERHAA
ncbi:MAG TPA: hypothetical protein VNS09_26300 [Solirubrobacter sp.]|nr:hypothetical protein [Solirubrobacter sp.]